MGLFVWIAIGCIVGALARAAALGRVRAGWLDPILMGIAGAVVGGWIGTRAVGANGIDNLGTLAMIIAAVGAAILVVTYLVPRHMKRVPGKQSSINEHGQRAA